MGIKGKIKLLVNASIHDPILHPTIESEVDPLDDVVPVKKGKCIVDPFSFKVVCSILLLSLLLVNGVWLVVETMNGSICGFEGIVNLINNVVLVFIIAVISQILIIPARWLDHTG